MELINYLALLRQKMWLIVLIVFLTLIATAVATSYMPITYTAVTTLESEKVRSFGTLGASPKQESKSRQYAELIDNPSFKTAVAKKVNKIKSKHKSSGFQVEMEPLSAPNLFNIYVVARDPSQAKQLANTAAEVLIEQNGNQNFSGLKAISSRIDDELKTIDKRLSKMRKKSEELRTASTTETDQIIEEAGIKDEVRASEALRTNLRNQIEQSTSTVKIADFNSKLSEVDDKLAKMRRSLEDMYVEPGTDIEKTIEIAHVQDDVQKVASLRRLFTDFESRLILSEVLGQDILFVVYPATTPASPTSPNWLNNLLMALAGGVLLSFVTVIVFHQNQIESLVKDGAMELPRKH